MIKRLCLLNVKSDTNRKTIAKGFLSNIWVSNIFSTTNQRTARNIQTKVNKCNDTQCDLFKQYSHSNNVKHSRITFSTIKKYCKDEIDMDFSDTKQAYKSKTNYELLRACAILKLCTFNYLVFHHAVVSKLLFVFKKIKLLQIENFTLI